MSIDVILFFDNTHLKRILSVILLKMLSPVVYGSFWKSEMVLHTTSVLVLTRIFQTMEISILFPPTIPVSFEERDKVKLRERLVQGCSPFVGEHEQGVVAAGTSDADKLPQGVQEVVWTCDGREE